MGDCVLPIPTRLKDFHVLREKLGKIYGEEYDIPGTPYIRHIDLAGGGLCAQAVCFMATLLLHRYARGVYGLADITILAKKERPREYTAGGNNRELYMPGR